MGVRLLPEITVYRFEDKNGREKSWTTTDVNEAQHHARFYGLKLLADNYEWQDTELVADYSGLTRTPSKVLNDVIAKLQVLAEKNENVQFAVDDLVYENIGSNQHARDINNSGIHGQAEELAKVNGAEWVLAELTAILECQLPSA